MQNLLETNAQVSQFFMGIGSGGGVACSGEKATLRLLKQKVKPPYCIFDVGSNKGQFLQVVLDGMGKNELSIHCFEPGRRTFETLSESYKDNMQIALNNVGIGKEKGKAKLYSCDADSKLASLTKRRLDHIGIDFSESEEVEITTIDDYCSANKVDHIHLLKLDIEGHELDALVGAKRMFDNKAIDIVTFEFGGCNIDTRTFFQDFWYFFNTLKMSIFRITPSGYLHPVPRYTESLEQFRTTNYVVF